MKSAELFQNENRNGGSYNIHWNACVGNNGWIGIDTYIDGYQAATLVMLESALKLNSTDNSTPKKVYYWNVDTAVYPILFSARHFIELYLKQKIYQINFFKLHEKIENKLIKTHNVSKLWNVFTSIVNKTQDSRLYEYIDLLEPYINDFSDIDLTGETFRYPYGSNNKKHLEDYSVIGLYNFYEKFNELSEIFMNFTYVMDYLVDEYQVRTYTKKLSRQDIEEISNMLPVYEKWHQEDFDEIKKQIKSKFAIGSRELSDAINIIKKHMEFRRRIYPAEYLLKLSQDKLTAIVNKKITKSDFDKFSLEEIACLRTIVELGTAISNGRYYSEHYQGLFEDFLKECTESFHLKLDNYEYSLNNLQRIPRGLKILGYSDILK